MTDHSPDNESNNQSTEGRFWFKRSVGLLILIALLVTAYSLDLHKAISLENLKENKETLTEWVGERPVMSVLAYMLVYIIVVAVSLPVGSIMTLLGGFLFGPWLGTLLVVTSATTGATILFFAARTALAGPLHRRVGKYIRPMEEGFNENAFSYMLTLRLVPFFPFWVVNLVPAFLDVPLRTYVIATLIGIIPGSLVYASVGNGLGTIFDQGGTPDLGIIFTPPVLLPLLGLAALALIPVVYQTVAKARRSKKTGVE